MLIEAIKAVCRLLLLHVTRSRPLLTPALPEREAVPGEPLGDDEASASELWEESPVNDSANGRAGPAMRPSHVKEWEMPRTGTHLPSLPSPADITSYLLSRVLTADDIKPATKLVNQVQGSAQAAEVLHILAPLAYAVALSRSRNKKSWMPWLIGLSLECAARQLRDNNLRTTVLERDEWQKRGWAMAWWAMRGAFYENFTKGIVGGVRARMPSLVAGILEDYEYLWENYYFSTST
jgi:peroxin-16